MIVLLVCVFLIIRERYTAAHAIGSSGVRMSGWLPVLMLAPAVLSIAVWSYYPLLRGLVMAFQNYQIVGGSTWRGLDNFIAVATDHNFLGYLAKTIKYVVLVILFGFLSRSSSARFFACPR